MKNNSVHELFRQKPHPQSVSDYYHCYNESNILNVLYWWNFLEMTKDVEGDIVECGVGRGRSLITLLSLDHYLETSYESMKPRKVFALDSFEGFPDPTPFDNSPRNPKKGDWSKSPNNQFDYSVEEIRKVLACADLVNLGEDKLEMIKGFFDKTTPHLNVEKIAILHLDGDLYESVLAPLQNLWRKVEVGGVVVIDDYIADETTAADEAFPGARKAIEEFMQTNTNFDFKVSIRGTPYLLRTH